MLFDSRGGFSGSIDDDIAEIERLRVVAMATNFGTNIAINWLVWTIVTRQLVMQGGGFECLAERMQILPILCT